LTVKVGVLGTGWGTQIQVPCFKHAGLEVIGLWGRNKVKTRDLAEQLAIPNFYDDYQDLIMRDDIDLISIATPPFQHAEMSCAVLEAGKHLICEKPLALNLAEAKKMLHTSRLHKHQYALVDHELRFLPAFQQMRSLVQAGYVGQPLVSGVQYQIGSRLDPTRKWDWKSDREKGGGLLGAIGSHFIDLITWILDDMVDKVFADLHVFVNPLPDKNGEPRQVSGEDYMTLQLHYWSGVHAVFDVSFITFGQEEIRLYLAGTQGKLEYLNGRLLGEREGLAGAQDLTPINNISLPAGLPDRLWVQGTLAFASALHAALAGSDREALSPAANFAQAVKTQEVLEAALLSGELREWVQLDHGTA
jgi:predicted dehydrogenase